MARVFVSWAGEDGKVVAGRLKSVLEEVFDTMGQPVNVTFSPITHRVGGDWRTQIRDNLLAADVGVAVLDPAALRSSWVAFEAGFLVAGGDTEPKWARLLPLLLCESVDPVRGTPFDSLQCASLAPQGLERLAEALLAAFCMDAGSRSVAYLAKALGESLVPAWEEARDAARGTNERLIEDLEGVLSAYARFGLLDGTQRRQLEHLLAATQVAVGDAGDASLMGELSEIARLFQECVEPRNGEFGQLAADWALRHLIVDAHVRLSEIAHGKIPVRNRAPVRSFWLHSVFGRAQKSVWTTNVAKPGVTMGSMPHPKLLGAQEDAIKRGVAVTRLFVYNEDMADAEARVRRNLMRLQVEAGIDVLVITEAEFRTQADAENAEKRIGSDDFMLIDDTFVYLTFPEEADEIEAAMLNGNDHQYLDVLDAARAFRDLLGGFADRVTLDNVNRFPGILA